MTCRDEILDCAKYFEEFGKSEFTIQDVIAELQRAGSHYTERTIRTHVSSRMCANAPNNHATTYDDLERVRRGIYRIAHNLA